jgi:hypothetical protein
MKILIYLVVFALGAGTGIWWSVNHPDAAVDIAAREQQQAAKLQAAVAQAKIELLQKFLASSDSSAVADPNASSNDAGYHRMLSDEQQKLSEAKKRLASGDN